MKIQKETDDLKKKKKRVREQGGKLNWVCVGRSYLKHIIIWTQFLEDNGDNTEVDESLLQEMDGLKLRMKRMIQIKEYTCDEHKVMYGRE